MGVGVGGRVVWWSGSENVSVRGLGWRGERWVVRMHDGLTEWVEGVWFSVVGD